MVLGILKGGAGVRVVHSIRINYTQSYQRQIHECAKKKKRKKKGTRKENLQKPCPPPPPPSPESLTLSPFPLPSVFLVLKFHRR